MKVSDNYKGLYPTRHEYAPREELPEFVELAKVSVSTGRSTPGYLVQAGVDPVWNHVAAMGTEYRDGCYRPTLDGKVRLIVTSYAEHRRHPEFDDMRFDDAEQAYRFAYEQGLLRVLVFPPQG